jgi:hypothetical protein
LQGAIPVLRINRISPATTGFVTTVVLTCAFAVLAASMWMPRGAATVVNGDAGTSSSGAVLPVQQAAR